VVSPRGHVPGETEANFTTTTQRDAQGRAVKVTDPLNHQTATKYDGDGNVETTTDPEGHVTTYTYDADNERIKVKEADETVTETGYDGAGQVRTQTDGNKHTTTYGRNVLEQVTEVIDPLGRTTTKSYDAAGNMTSLTDAAKRTTTYSYDPANHLSEVKYSDGSTPTVKYEYDADDNRTVMIDGTGTSTYAYDQLDRLTEYKDGHGNIVAYGYDLANEQTSITYPNGKAVARIYDKAGRLQNVTDWAERTTQFAYDANSNLTSTSFPAASGNVDSYTYDDADQMSEVKMKKGSETLASVAYARNSDGQVSNASSTGLPGTEPETAYSYDANKRLTKAGSRTYEYDAANRPTKLSGASLKYDAASELESSTGASYAYNELGERMKTTPTSGPAITYGYDQAGNLVSVSRPMEGETAAIADTYGYNGDGLRASESLSGSTTYFAWSVAERLPLIINDGTYSFIYGPGGLPVEEINAEGHPTYLHHDQQGSTRLLTASTGSVEGAVTYDPYGGLAARAGSAHAPLGYSGQYTDSDTGLMYLRARSYDPATAQFLSVDPVVQETLAPYTYAQDDPLSRDDPSGLCATASAASYRSPNKEECLNKFIAIAQKRVKLNKRAEDIFMNRRESLREAKQHKKAWQEKKENLEDALRTFIRSGCEKRFPAEFGVAAREELAELEQWQIRIRIVVRPI
jgi:RHS repeat-associated protein